jgi:hypothetical protein
MPKFEGFVREITVSGDGANSAENTFVIRNSQGNEEKAFDLTTNHLPQVFSAITTVLTAAYFVNAKVEVTYREVPKQTPIATAVKIAKYLT